MSAILIAVALMAQPSSKYDAAPIDPTSEGMFLFMREKPFWQGTSEKTPNVLTLCIVSALWHYDLNASAFSADGAIYVKNQFTLAKLTAREGGGTEIMMWGGGGSRGGIVPRVRGCI